MGEYRIDEIGTIHEMGEFFSSKASIIPLDVIEDLWERMSPVEIDEDTDLADLQRKLWWIHEDTKKQSIGGLYVKDPTKVLKLKMNPL